MKYLIMGGCGFLGSNLAADLIAKGEEVTVFDNLFRTGSSSNLDWLRKQGKFTYVHGDTRSYNDVERVVRDLKPQVIFHLAGQVAMTTSLADPRLDFEINVLGGHNLLETVRKFSPESTVIYSSTNKVYGDLDQFQYDETPTRYVARGFENGFDEAVPLDFRSPYGCSKGATDQYMLDYARMFGLKTVVFRHSSIFGGRQHSTFDQGWIGWFVKQALDAKKGVGQEFTISGNGKQVRDVLFVTDLVSCYLQAVKHIDRAKGQAFNIGGGAGNSLSLLELFIFLEKELGVKLKYRQLPWRQSDQKVFVADITKAQKLFDWTPRASKEQGLRGMIEWMQSDDSST